MTCPTAAEVKLSYIHRNIPSVCRTGERERGECERTGCITFNPAKSGGGIVTSDKIFPAPEPVPASYDRVGRREENERLDQKKVEQSKLTHVALRCLLLVLGIQSCFTTHCIERKDLCEP